MYTTILIIGAGKSASVLIDYLQKKSIENGWYIIVADGDKSLAEAKWKKSPNGHAIGINIEQATDRAHLIQQATIVISMLPAALHFLVAKDCIHFKKSLFTASYVDENMSHLATEIESKKLLFLCEMGLDPGIDHMSAMELIHRIQNEGGTITGFKSHCGGLIAPESDNNPWHYKISWNPQNIILAGKSGALFLENGVTKRIEYEQLFTTTPIIDIPSIGPLAYYPNRNSLPYIDTYQLKQVRNFIRTTLRYLTFCSGWDALIQLGLTRDEYVYDALDLIKLGIVASKNWTVKNWFHNHLQQHNAQMQYANMLQNEQLKEQLLFIGLEEDTLIPTSLHSNTAILQWLLERKWKLAENDKDMVVMMHEITYDITNKNTSKKDSYLIQSSMVLKGEDNNHTAMATTVGLPLAMAVCAYLKGEITLTGLHIPIHPSIYKPILNGLAAQGIVFKEKISKLN